MTLLIAVLLALALGAIIGFIVGAIAVGRATEKDGLAEMVAAKQARWVRIEHDPDGTVHVGIGPSASNPQIPAPYSPVGHTIGTNFVDSAAHVISVPAGCAHQEDHQP